MGRCWQTGLRAALLRLMVLKYASSAAAMDKIATVRRFVPMPCEHIEFDATSQAWRAPIRSRWTYLAPSVAALRTPLGASAVPVRTV